MTKSMLESCCVPNSGYFRFHSQKNLTELISVGKGTDNEEMSTVNAFEAILRHAYINVYSSRQVSDLVIRVLQIGPSKF